MDSVEYGALKIAIEKQPDKVQLKFRGKSDSRNPADILGPFFKDLLEDDFKKLVVDFTGLEFINSSTIPPLVMFIRQLETKQIQSEFVYSGDVKWQVMTFNVLQKLVTAQKVTNVIIRPDL